MIPFFLVKYGNRDLVETREQQLARQMGYPPWELKSVLPSQNGRKLANAQKGPLIGFIFDPEFWYSHRCWGRWVAALLQDGAGGTINAPLGNQDPSWRTGLNVPVYLTLRGLENASDFEGSSRWIVKRGERPESYCVVVAPVSIIKELPEDLNIGDLPSFWARSRQEVRIFCEGWLHSFNAIKDAGSRHDLISMCKWHGMVLELGCGVGLMARTCKEVDFDVCWIGVDLNGKALFQARSFLDMAVQADINLPLPFSHNIKFDRVVCGDVLEHLPYPWDLLSSLRQWMQPDGLLIASFPNVGHWSVVEDLLAGRWDETPSGIFCVSHLRFGTKKSWERWFEKSGWRIIKWEEEKAPLPNEWIISPDRCQKVCDLESLETVRYRLSAQVTS